jgi:CHAT domain-containing protein
VAGGTLPPYLSLFVMASRTSRVSRFRWVAARLVLAAAVGLCVATPDARVPQAAGAEPAAVIAAGAALDRPIGAGDTHRFRLDIRQGQAIKVVVDQHGADVRVALDQAPAPTAACDDDWKHHFGREVLVWLAPASGSIQITIAAQSVVPAGGSYHLAVTLFDPSDTLTRAVTALNEGRSLFLDDKRAGAERAAQQLQQAVQDWTSLGDRDLLGVALYSLTYVQGHQLSQVDDALATGTKALALYDAPGLETEWTEVLGLVGIAQYESSLPEQALATYAKAYARADAIDPLNRAVIEDRISRAAGDTGDVDRAASFGERAAATFHAAHATNDEFITLGALSLVYSRSRQFDTALRTITKALELSREHGDADDVASLMLVLGRVQVAAGDDGAALAAYQRALELVSETSHNLTLTQLSLGRLYNRQGDVRAAREVLERALATTSPQSKSLWAGTASELGVSLARDGDPVRALTLQEQAFEIVNAGQNRLGQLTVLRDLTATYRTLGNVAQADVMLDRAATVAGMFPGHPYASVLFRERARNARAAGDLPRARQQLDAAIALIESDRGRLQTEALRSSFGNASAAFYDDAIDLAMAMHAQAPREGHDGRAFELFERSRARSLTDLLSEARVDIRAGVDPSLLAEQRDLQRELGRKDTTLRDLGSSPAAKARAAALEQEIEDIVRRLEVIGGRIREASPHYAALSNPAPASLRETQQLLDDDTVMLAFALGPSTSWGWAITSSHVSGFQLPGARQIEAQAQRVYTGMTARQRHDNHLAQVDQQLARDSAALSDLVLGPIAASLQGEWRTRRLAIVATGPLEYIPFSALPAPAVTPAAPAAPRSDAGAPAPALASRSDSGASAPTLPSRPDTGPSAPALASRPDAGAAATATATAPASASASASAKPRAWLVDQHEIVQLPSASVLALLRHESSSRPAPTTQVAVIADPVFDVDDPRVATSTANVAVASRRIAATGRTVATRTRGAEAGDGTGAGAAQDGTTNRSANANPNPNSNGNAGANAGAGAATVENAASRLKAGAAAPDTWLPGVSSDPISAQFARLIFSRKEAQAIARLAPRGSAIEALDFSANVQMIASPAVARARIVHVASHGIFNSARPELSGLVLSLVDQKGHAAEGILRLYDIFNLRLSADLVVLSGCETGLGRQMKGEGLIGLTRAFMYAGAPRVVASRWQVDDVATAELMSRFYAGIFQKHLRPAAALHAAQQQMRAVPRWQSPYYWAAFTLLGDWR